MTDLIIADSETRSLADVTAVGAYAYARHPSTECLVWGWVEDDGPGQVWSPGWCYGNTEFSRADPPEPTALLDHIENGGYIAFWNAAFDRHIWNQVMVSKYGWPPLRLSQVLCAQAQAEANNLPGKLEKACEALGTPFKKDSAGAQLIQQLSVGDRSTWNPEVFEKPEKMGRFRSYCVHDCVAARGVWQYTRPLTADEWADYHVSERINDRGVAVDREFAFAASRYAADESRDINNELAQLTGDRAMTVTNHVRKAKWLYEQLWPDEELQELVRRPPKKGKERRSADRATREAVLDMLSQPAHIELFEEDHAEQIIEFIELIEAGNSAAVHKFTAIFNYAHQGRIHGQYSFNGAGQTGRFSSRGVQVHNLIRSPVEEGNPDRAIDAVEDILDGVPADKLAKKYHYPISRLLARLIRPTFIAPEGRVLVWADWDQIEARVLPWLADSPGAEAKLDLFRARKDVYRYAAMPIFNLRNPDDCDKQQRQVGKVAELALGFGGAVGAFSAMGRGYGVVVPAETAREIVVKWRAQNAWCVHYWHELWEAAMNAFHAPGTWFRAGRVRYLYHPQLMRGTLICELPCGRWIVYPQFKHERVDYEDDDGNLQTRWITSYVRGFGSGSARVELWYGKLAENITQGTAASFLRLALRRLDIHDIIVLHTHDELVAEVSSLEMKDAKEVLAQAMTDLPRWGEGLPLTVSIDHGPFYTK